MRLKAILLFLSLLMVVFTSGSYADEAVDTEALGGPDSSAFALSDHRHLEYMNADFGVFGKIAVDSVFRVTCTSDDGVVRKSLSGTGFLHRSGKVITAEHVISGCDDRTIEIKTASGRSVRASVSSSDRTFDLALLDVDGKIEEGAFTISGASRIKKGSPVSTWGYPAGYTGTDPLLITGHYSGKAPTKTYDDTAAVTRLIVNAAINSGNSGGPLINVKDGRVIGVVVSKMAPLPAYISDYLELLEVDDHGDKVVTRKPDGSRGEMTQGQIIAEVLEYLRKQTQMVIGHAVILGDLRAFLKDNGIDP
jgi:hypothetical protein